MLSPNNGKPYTSDGQDDVPSPVDAMHDGWKERAALREMIGTFGLPQVLRWLGSAVGSMGQSFEADPEFRMETQYRQRVLNMVATDISGE